MKTKLKLQILLPLILILINSCAKKEVKTNTANVHQSIDPALVQLEQKNYNCSTRNTIEIIKKFKNLESQNSQAKLIDSDSLSLDSSVFVLESALNYDFDYQFDKNYTLSSITLTASINTSGNNKNINSNDLETVYTNFYNTVNPMINDSIKILLLDVEAYIYIPSQNVAVYVIEGKLINTNRFVTCDDTPCNNCPNYGPVSSITYYNWFGVTTGLCDPFPEMNTHINCDAVEASYPCLNSERVFYNGLSVVIFNPLCSGFNNNPYPGALYASNYSTLASLQANPLSFTNNYGDNLFNGCKLLVQNNTPVGKVFRWAFISPGTSPCVGIINNNNVYSVDWKLQAQFAYKHCVNINN